METIEVLEELELSKNNFDAPTEKKKKRDFSRLDRSLFQLLLILVFLLPLFFVPLLGVSVELEKSLFLALGIGLGSFLFILARLTTGVYTIPRTPILFGGFLVVVAFFLSALFSPAPHVSLFGAAFESTTVMAIFVLFLTLFFSSIVFQSERRVTAFYKALFASFAVLFLYHLIRIIFGADLWSFNLFFTEAATPIGRWNDFGIFAGIIALVSIVTLEFGALSALSRKSMYVFLVAALVSLAVVNFSLLWIILGLFSLMLAVYNFTVRQNGIGWGVATPSLFVLIVSLLFLIGGGSLGNVFAEYSNTPQLEIRPSWEATIGVAADVWRGDPLFGNGPNRFSHAWSLYKPEGINATAFWNTSFDSGVGTLPSYAVTTGFLGVLALLFLLASYLYSGARVVFFEGSHVHYLTLSLFLSSFYLWLSLLFYTPSITILFLTFVLTGVFIAFSVQRGYISNLTLTHKKDVRVGFVSVLLLIVLLAGTVDMEYVGAQKSLSLYNFHKAVLANRDGDRENAKALLLQANLLNENDRFYRSLVELQLADLNELLTRENARPEEVRAEFQQTLGSAISSARGAVSFDESNYLNWLSLFQVYGNVVRLQVVEGAYENAQESLNNAQARNPQSPALLLRGAELELATGNADTARAALQSALALKEDYTDAIFLLAQLEINEGNTRSAIDSLLRASLIDPNNVSLFFSLGLLYYNEQNFVQATEALERVVFLSPQYSNAKYYLGLSYYERERNDEAITEFEEILTLNPGNELVITILDNLREGRPPLAGVGETGGESIEPPIIQ
ncbi:MAG: tetratricopeptide repeat protein [Candidatus Paceibacterota bacterium]